MYQNSMDQKLTCSAASDNVARPVWFSYAGVTGRLVYDNDFKYNPATNTLTVDHVTGEAGSAVKLNDDAGSANQPVYFSGGKPVATTHTLGASVPADAAFTDTTYEVATEEAAGLMPKEAVSKLDGIQIVDIGTVELTADGWDGVPTGLPFGGKYQTAVNSLGILDTDVVLLRTIPADNAAYSERWRIFGAGIAVGGLYFYADAPVAATFAVSALRIPGVTTGYVLMDGLATLGEATGSNPELMSPEDKLKLDGMGGGDYSLPTASADTLGGVKVGANLSIEGGVLDAKMFAPATETTPGVSGIVPAPAYNPQPIGGFASLSRFLRDDGRWAEPCEVYSGYVAGLVPRNAVFGGTPSIKEFLRGDGEWAEPQPPAFALLWEGSWSTGTITVSNASDYAMFVVEVQSVSDAYLTRCNIVNGNAFVEGSGSGYSSAGSGVNFAYFKATVSGDQWTYVRACFSANPTTKRAVTRIWGIG